MKGGGEKKKRNTMEKKKEGKEGKRGGDGMSKIEVLNLKIPPRLAHRK